MNYFPDKIHFDEYDYHNGSLRVIITEDYCFNSKLGKVIVPKGFISDGASIPRFLWGFLSPFGEYFRGAVCHDWGYSKYNTTFTRKQVDDYFLEAMTILGVNEIKRYTIYKVVRLFGWMFFQKKIN